MPGVVHHVEDDPHDVEILEQGAAVPARTAALGGERVGAAEHRERLRVRRHRPEPLTVGRVVGRLVPPHRRLATVDREQIVRKAVREVVEIREVDLGEASHGRVSTPSPTVGSGMAIPVCYNRKHHSVTAGAAMTTDARENTSTTDRPMRSDARRNRERVLAAAEDVFAEMGLKAQVEEVARRAGVGVGTVCRHFPTKQALVEAVLEADVRVVARRRPRRRSTEPDPGAAFETFFVALAAFQARHRALAEQMATDARSPACPRNRLREALRQAITELVANAQAGRRVRADIGPADIAMLFSGVAHTTALAGDLQPVLRRALRHASSSTGCARLNATELPGTPLDFAAARPGQEPAPRSMSSVEPPDSAERPTPMRCRRIRRGG